MKQGWVRDGLFMAVRVLAIMNEREMTLSQLLMEVPDFYIHKKLLEIDVLPTELSELLGLDNSQVSAGKEGITLREIVVNSYYPY